MKLMKLFKEAGRNLENTALLTRAQRYDDPELHVPSRTSRDMCLRECKESTQQGTSTCVAAFEADVNWPRVSEPGFVGPLYFNLRLECYSPKL